MKKLVVCLMALMLAGLTNAQITELKEARVGFDPLLPEITVEGDNYIFKVQEEYSGEFEEDPVAFLDKHCKIEAFIDLVQDGKTLEYEVAINSTKGKMRAKYCKEGNLLKLSYKLKNVLLPAHLQEEVYRNYKGWNMTRNIHVAKGKDGELVEEYYKIRLERAGEVQNLRIDVQDMADFEFAVI